jgi:holo-[acyl-carrier protein] synthase
MIVGIGTDLVRVDRLRNWLATAGLVERFFSAAEHHYCLAKTDNAAASLAARFAAKEALGKALGSGLRGLRLRDIEVVGDELGQPKIILHGQAKRGLDQKGQIRIHLSLSHERDYAIAMVVLETDGEKS